MISVYFNTTLDGYYQVTVSIFFFFAGKKIVSSDVFLTHKASSLQSEIFNRKFGSFMGYVSLGQTSSLNLDKLVGVDR